MIPLDEVTRSIESGIGNGQGRGDKLSNINQLIWAGLFEDLASELDEYAPPSADYRVDTNE